MKKKLVLWGTNANDERTLIALQLHPKANKISIYTFPEEEATEAFTNRMMNEWRNDQEVPFPENHNVQERELTVSDGLLPDDLKVERGDVVQRAQTEWHFIVLSSKLFEAYESELSELKSKVEELQSFDSGTWDSLKTFWSKVQGQVKERNLFRDHANDLRENTNQLFSKLKEMRSALDEEFKNLSETHFNTFMGSLEDLETKVSKGLNLSGIFDDLKKLQKDFRDTKFTKEHRSKVWERLDGAFKNVKELRFGAQGASGNSPMERLTRRYEGLIAAIEKMERSIKRDRDDLKFQDRKFADSDGQLEQQIRQAKIKMIEGRIHSKEEKLGDMMKTKTELERRMEVQKEKDAKQAERDRIKEAREAAKAKIAEDIKSQEVARTGSEDELKKAASAIVEDKKKAKPEGKSTIAGAVDAISSTMGEALEDVVDTAKAVASVISDNVKDAVEQYTKKDSEEEKAGEDTPPPPVVASEEEE